MEKENIKQKHKYSLNDFNIGDEIYMYGVLIGKAIQPIPEGSPITMENVKHASAEYQDVKEKFIWNAPDVSNFAGRTFEGFHREDGKVGTANYWLVIPLVFCENRNVDVLEGALTEKLGYETKKDFAVDTEALINQYKAGATNEAIFNTPIITTKEEIDFLSQNKGNITFEITPQHLTFYAPDCYDKIGTYAQMNPPIRNKTHQDRLWYAIKNNYNDTIGSDHAPHLLSLIHI